MFYIEKIENHKIGQWTESKSIANELGWTISLKEIEQSDIDFCWYEKGFAPMYTEEEKAQQEQEKALSEAKQERAIAVQNIEVEVDGMVFDGNEDAQRRITIALQTGDITGQQTVDWVLKNNTVANVTRSQLEQVLVLSMQKMQELWTKPYIEIKEVNE